MRIAIESTDELGQLDGVPVRLWRGVTAGGIPVRVYVHRIAVAENDRQTDFERELQNERPPRRVSEAFVLAYGCYGAESRSS